MQDYRIPGVDEQDLRQKGQKYFDKMRAAYSRRDFKRRPTQELFPPVYKIVE